MSYSMDSRHDSRIDWSSSAGGREVEAMTETAEVVMAKAAAATVVAVAAVRATVVAAGMARVVVE